MPASSTSPGRAAFALTARISTPLAARSGREASLGFALRRGRIGIIVEERFALDGARRAQPSATLFGGFDGVRVAGKLRLDGYGQLGAVGLRRPQGFADGALRIEHPLIGRAVRLAAGAGAWGGVQPGLARLDVGPQAVLRVPTGPAAIRIAAEYRFRVAGNAAPGSGPAIGIGMDF